jgi:signal peptidase II
MVKKVINETLVYWVAAVVIFFDQYTKYWVRANLSANQTWNPITWLAPYARLLHTQNTGAAFGMFKEASLLFAVIAVIVSAVIVYYALRMPPGHWWMRIVLGMQLGGALGNLIDRVLFDGNVTDFVSLTIPGINYDFAVFNVADASISVGVVLLMLIMWLEGRSARKDAPPGHLDKPEPPADLDEVQPPADPPQPAPDTGA